ncbi:tyrosine-type recombinase/integrase [Nocardiopsis sp. FR4]|uniref:tyrosine-type recombinase/integrase n=1 Tax=Nocardiopsis sp. FR4 TaxID=2605985 RepID=UPI001357EC26|nr:tyrosine-type recombinase/integrase [Nocardiopsis sp. FR4]
MSRKRSNGDGSVAPRTLKSGKTVYDVWVSYTNPVTGLKERYIKKGFKTKTEAEKHRREKVAEAQRQALVNPSDQKLSVYLDTWLEGHRIKQQTKAGYERKIRLHVKPHVGEVKLGRLTGIMLTKLYRTLEEKGSPYPAKGPLSARSVREVHTILSAALNQAVKDGLLVVNPAVQAKPPTTKEAAPPEFSVWSGEELRAFLHAERDTAHHPVWHFIASTGVRRGEALGLRWQDIDLEAKTAVIRQTVGVIEGRIIREPLPKSSKPRVIDLDEKTVKVLKRHRVTQAKERLELGSRWLDEGLVFAKGSYRLRKGTFAGGPMHPDRVSRVFDARIHKHGLKDIRLHDLRHTWATLALKAGVPVKVVQERLGHANPSITMNIYAHALPGMQAHAAEQVAALFG